MVRVLDGSAHKAPIGHTWHVEDRVRVSLLAPLVVDTTKYDVSHKQVDAWAGARAFDGQTL